MTYSKIFVAKQAAKFVVGISTGHCIRKVVTNNLEPETKAQDAKVVVGSYVAGAMVADAAESWTDRQIDQLVETYNEIKTQFKNFQNNS